MTSPTTVVALVDLTDDSRGALAVRFDDITVLPTGDHGRIMRELESNEPAGTLVLVADAKSPSATVSELDRYAKRFERAVLVVPHGMQPHTGWTHDVDQL